MNRMNQKYPRLSALVGSIALTVIGGSPAVADDTEIFVSQGSGAQPNILLILDTSGSMDSAVTTQAPYDPSVTYAGSCTAGRIYWRAGSGDPPDCGSNRWFNAARLVCNAAVQGINTAGRYLAQRAAQWNATSNHWEQVRDATKDQPVECSADAGVHGETAGDPKVYAFNSGVANDRWTADAANQLDWNGSSVNQSYTFYSANWLNWRNDTSSFVTLSRLQIVQDVASNFVASISGVNIGLMRYSNNGGSGDAQAEGGMVYSCGRAGGERPLADSWTASTRTRPTDSRRCRRLSTKRTNTIPGGNVFYGRDCATGATPCSQVQPGQPLPSVPASREPGDPGHYHSPAQTFMPEELRRLSDGR